VKHKIEKTNVQEIFELSTVQKGMLFHYLKETDQNQYNVQLVLGLEGKIDIGVLEQALQSVQLNHEALRSVFSWDKVSKPLQVVLKNCPIDFIYYNIARNSQEYIDDYVSECLANDQVKRFELTSLPVRVTLIRTAAESFIMSISHHHILYDGWSTGIFLQELFSAYRQLSGGDAVQSFARPSYKQVLQALRKRPSGHHIASFWNKYLQAYDIKLFFNTKQNTTQINKCGLAIPGNGLDNFAMQHNVTKASVIYAAFGLLLQQYLNTNDIVFGTTVSDRDAALSGIEKVMGNFINTIPLRLQSNDEDTLAVVVRTVHAELLERSTYNSTSYYEIRELLKLKQDEQLFDTLLVVENYPLDEAKINCNDDFTVGLNAVYEHTSFPLVVSVFFEPQLRVELAWKAGYMEHDFAQTLAEHFGKLLNQVIEHSDAQVQSISLLSENEIHQLVEEFNNTSRPYPKNKTIVELFEEQAERTPDAVAIKYGRKQLSYAALNHYADRVAAYLREMKGINKNDLAGLLLERDEHLVPVILGVLKAGAAYVPIDPEYPPHRVSAIVTASGLKVLLTRSNLLNAQFDTDIVDLDRDLDVMYNYPSAPASSLAGGKDLAYIIYTSGSTGAPKGVMITHQSLVNYISWAAEKYAGEQAPVFPLYTSISFDLTVTSIFTPLITGGTIVVFNDRETGFVIEKVLGNKEINVIKATPSHLKIVRDSNKITASLNDPVRTFIVGGEELSTQLANDIHGKFHGRVKIYNEYGPTEATVGCMIHLFDPNEKYTTVPIGVPAQNTRIYVLNKHLHAVPNGCTGELYIAGDGLAKGYLGSKELTSQKFIKDPFVKGGRMYRTGDLARRLPSGKLEFLGRADEQVKLRGFRIELTEIENHLRSYEGIREAAVLVKEKNNDKFLAAWYVADNEIPLADIKSYLQRNLPAYMMPAYFIRVKSLPLTANGKLDKRALPDPTPAPVAMHAKPTGETEAKLLQIWSEVLGQEHISIHSNFFDIGGDSLKLLTVSSKIKNVLGKDVQVTDLTFYPTIASLAKFIDPAVEAAQPAVQEVTEVAPPEKQAIAVIGMAGRFPGANDIEGFWENLAAGKELIVRGENRTGRNNVINAKGMLQGYDLFDTEFFEYSPADAAMMDPQIRVFHECVWEALENAGYAPGKYNGAIGLYGGATTNPYYNLNVNIPDNDQLLEEWAALTYSDKDFLCPRVSYKLNLKGPSVNVFTACSTSLVAIETACNELLAKKCSIAVAGGVSITLHDNDGYVYRPGMVMSPDGYCRAFDEKAAGTVGGNGTGAVVLKRLDEALRDNDHIYAIIKGTATNNDGNEKLGFAAPAMEGQAKVIEAALKNAGVEAESISYVETHGSGTLIGDPIEVTALTRAFNTSNRQYCAIGSVKTNIGHLDAAAGVAGFIKTVLALQHKQIPPSLHYEKPNPSIDFSNSPFYVSTELSHWKNGQYPRRAGVSSFGIGGTNVHIVMEEAPALPVTSPGREYKLLLFSGKTPLALEKNIRKHAEFLKQHADQNVADVAYTLQTGREHFAYRKIAVCKNNEDAVPLLEELAKSKTPSPYSGEHRPQVVFMFSGQGSQYVNMCRDLYEKEPFFRQTVDDCLELAKEDLKAIMFSGDAATLDRTEHTQPALFIIEYALARLLMHWGIQPDHMIGHSFGEYVAACISGAFSLEDALFLVTKRGELMQNAPAGVTIAVAISAEKLQTILNGRDDISLAVVNSSELCVVAGDEEAVYALQTELTKAGHSCSIVSTHHAFHSPKMDAILAEFEQCVKQVSIRPAQIPFISNLSGRPVSNDEISNPNYWVRHLRNTVQFANGIEHLMQNKEVMFIETGPGIELCTFVRSLKAKQKTHRVVNLVRHADTEGDDQHHLLTALGKLYQAGIEPDWTKFYSTEKRRKLPLPTYSFARTQFPVKKLVIPQKDELVRLTDISKWFYIPTWKMAPWTLSAQRDEQPVLLFDGDMPVTRLISDVFRHNGENVIHVRKGVAFAEESSTSFTIDTANENDYRLLFERLAKRNLVPGRIIHAWSIDRNNEYEPAGTQLYEQYFYSLAYIVKAAEQHGGMFGKQLVFLSNDLHSIAGGEQIALLKSLPIGLLKVIGQEYPAATVNHIDIALSDYLHDALLKNLYNEIKQPTGGNTIAVRNGKKWVQAFDAIDSAKKQFRERGVYLITGGLGNVGYHLALHLAKNYKASLVLTGRTTLPDQTRLQTLEQQGSQLLYISCDASNVEQLRTAIAIAEEKFGALNGIVHAAGIVRGKSFNSISALTKEDYEHQFAAKVTGLQVLRQVAGDKPLDFCIITSSLSPILGGLEFGAYASANAYIEFFINHYRERHQLNNWICANIDGFNLDGGKGEGINEREVAEVFERILSVIHLPQVIVSVADIEKRVNRWVKRTEEKATDIMLSSEDDTTSNLSTTERKIKKIWQQFFGIPELDAEDDFFELGGDSLKGLTMTARIHKELNVEVPIKQLFNNSSIKKLASFIDGLQVNGNGTAKAGFRSIPQAPEKDSYPLSSVQSRIYFLYEFDRQSVAYNQALTLRLKGEVSKSRLQGAFRKLIRRHESLRTAFEIIAEEPRQRILDNVEFILEMLPASKHEEESIRRFVRPFELGQPPLIRAGLMEVAPAEHILVVDMHHIVTDAVSKGVLIKDFMAFYNDEELPAMPLQYKDFAEWQQGEQQQQEINRQKQFWLEEFSGELPSIELPADFPRPAVKNYDGSTVNFELSAEETAALTKIAEQEGSTMFMLLLSVYTILLGKLANQQDVIVGTITAGRQHSDLEGIIGMFVNTIPIRNKLRSDLSFPELMEQVRSKTLQCFENQSYPYEALIDELKVVRDSSRNPLFDALFSYRNYEQIKLEIPGLTIEPFEFATGVSNFDLTLSAIRRNDKLELEFEYCTRLFKRETIERFSTYFKNIIHLVIQRPQATIAEISLLPEQERQRLLFTFNDTLGTYNRQATIVSLFEQQALENADSIAVVYEGRQLSFRQFNELSNQWAHYLRTECSVQPDQAVAVMVERSEMMMVALLSVLKAGAAYVPIDPTYPQKRIEYILENSEAAVLFADKPVSGMRFEGRHLLLDNQTIQGQPASNPSHVNTSNDLCYIIYTSGSTGNPKGVMVSHRNVINFFAGMNQQLPLSDDDCMLAVTSTSFDISVLELFWTLCNGVQVVIHPADISLAGLDRYLSADEKAIDFSLFFFSSYNHGDEDKYRMLLESVQYADQEGFKAVWVPERHFHEFGGLFPNPSVLSAALAMMTQQLQLRAGSVVAPLHDAVRIVEEWSVVDNLSNGRVGLSFASGWNPNDFVLSKASYQERNKTLYAKIDEAKRLWRGESVKRMNGLGKEAELRVFPEPVQKELPVWITSGGSEDTFISAGASGSNLLTHLLGQDLDELARKIQLYRTARKEHGHDEGIVTVMLHTYVGDAIDEVEKIVEKPFVEYLKSSIGLSKILTEETGLKEDNIPEAEKERIINNAFRRYYKTGSLIGTRGTCSEMVMKLKRIGVNEIACLVDFGIEPPTVLAGLRNLKALKDYFKRHQRVHKPVTVLQSTPSFVKLMQEGGGAQQLLNSLRLLLIGGEAAPLSLVRQLRQDTPAAIWNMYGPTETTIWSCIHQFPEQVDKISVGKPIVNTQVYILSKEQELVPVGVTGELYIGGEGVSRGYWKNAELTAAKFISNPFRPGERIYRTGDLARWLPDGTIELAGREDHQLKIRGFRIEPGEIEACLLGLTGIKEAVVIAREEKGSSDRTLVAYLVAEDATDVTALRQYLANRLPHYMVPSHFVQLPVLPLTPNGKVDRKALPDPVIAVGRDYVAPSTDTEEKLVAIWSEILKIESSLVSVRSNFFELGGHSLNAMVMVRKILKEFNVEILLQKIFVINTIEQIADVIENERWARQETHSTEPAGEEIILD
jgi:polyketide synthase PksJ